MNALRLGLRASTVVLPKESKEDFMRLCDDLEAEWQPQTRTEQLYVEQMAICQWKLRRVDIGEKGFIINGSDTSELSHLNTVWQEAGRLERSFARAQRDLVRLQSSRRQPAQQPEDVPAWVVRVQTNNEVAESIPGIGDEAAHGPHLSVARVFQDTRESPSVEEFALPSDQEGAMVSNTGSTLSWAPENRDSSPHERPD